MICHNCGSTNEDGREYCRKCDSNLIEKKSGFGLIHKTTIKIDEIEQELRIAKKWLLGQSKPHKQIALSQIQSVRACMGAAVRGGRGGGTDPIYHCDLLMDGNWEHLITDGNKNRVLSLAVEVGRLVKSRGSHEMILAELSNHLAKSFRVAATVTYAVSGSREKERRLPYGIGLKYTLDRHHEKVRATNFNKRLTIEGIISLQGHPIHSIEVLHSDDPASSYYVLGFTVAAQTVKSTKTHRKKQFLGSVVDVEWKEGQLADRLNGDPTLRAHLVQHLRNPDCDVHITSDESSHDTMIIFDDSYPREWGQLPRELFSTEDRVKAVTLLANKVREFV